MPTMEGWTPLGIAALIFGALFIGIAKAGFGGGPGMLVPPLLALFLPPRLAIGLLLPLLLATDVFALRFFWRKWHVPSVAYILPGAVVGIWLGTGLLGQMPEETFRRVIGLFAVILGGLQLLRDRLVPADKVMRPVAWLGGLAGILCGLGSTLAHQGGVPVTLYLIPQRLDSVAFVGTTTAIFFFVNAAKIWPYLDQGMLPAQVLWIDLMLLPVLYLGTVVGVKLNTRVPRDTFLRVALWFVLLTGIKLLVG